MPGRCIACPSMYTHCWQNIYKTESQTKADWEHIFSQTSEFSLTIFDHYSMQSFLVWSTKAWRCEDALHSALLFSEEIYVPASSTCRLRCCIECCVCRCYDLCFSFNDTTGLAALTAQVLSQISDKWCYAFPSKLCVWCQNVIRDFSPQRARLYGTMWFSCDIRLFSQDTTHILYPLSEWILVQFLFRSFTLLPIRSLLIDSSMSFASVSTELYVFIFRKAWSFFETPAGIVKVSSFQVLSFPELS